MRGEHAPAATVHDGAGLLRSRCEPGERQPDPQFAAADVESGERPATDSAADERLDGEGPEVAGVAALIRSTWQRRNSFGSPRAFRNASQASYQSGRRDLNPRPLNPQNGGVGVFPGQEGFRGRLESSATWSLFTLVHGVWSQIGPKIMIGVRRKADTRGPAEPAA